MREEHSVLLVPQEGKMRTVEEMRKDLQVLNVCCKQLFDDGCWEELTELAAVAHRLEARILDAEKSKSV